MKIRKKMLSVFCAAMLLGTITSVTVPQVQASEEQTKKVDGSYLTMQESASGTSQDEDTKGQYIMVGECSITKAGRNRIYVYSGTTANRTVNLVSTIVYVDQYITVEPGYYYRVRADHFAGMQYPYESTYSFTDGIMIK